MAEGWIAVLLFALAGFLVGGASSLWKKSRVLAVVLGIAALLAAGGGVAWFMA